MSFSRTFSHFSYLSNLSNLSNLFISCFLLLIKIVNLCKKFTESDKLILNIIGIFI